jgi:2-polyprenyl-3-methyl-5-hydroxy-6-metoxy-1,4-benzoquinol methylase
MWIDEKFEVIKLYAAKYSNQSKTVIDLGARDQILLKFLPFKWRYTGVDKFAKKLNLNIDVEENFKDINKKYDVVIALDIIEHLNSPIKFFDNCKEICNELIILNIPNAAYYQFRLNFLFTGELTEKFHFSGNFEDDRHRWLTTFYNTKKFLRNLNTHGYNLEIKKIYKTRNKIRILQKIEKILGMIFPNFFCWSMLIFIKKNEKNI